MLEASTDDQAYLRLSTQLQQLGIGEAGWQEPEQGQGRELQPIAAGQLVQGARLPPQLQLLQGQYHTLGQEGRGRWGGGEAPLLTQHTPQGAAPGAAPLLLTQSSLPGPSQTLPPALDQPHPDRATHAHMDLGSSSNAVPMEWWAAQAWAQLSHDPMPEGVDPAYLAGLLYLRASTDFSGVGVGQLPHSSNIADLRFSLASSLAAAQRARDSDAAYARASIESGSVAPHSFIRSSLGTGVPSVGPAAAAPYVGQLSPWREHRVEPTAAWQPGWQQREQGQG
ncbi:hypothetical protein V8C86DRAFT_2622381, partial [Haematococcus lacustris]